MYNQPACEPHPTLAMVTVDHGGEISRLSPEQTISLLFGSSRFRPIEIMAGGVTIVLSSAPGVLVVQSDAVSTEFNGDWLGDRAALKALAWIMGMSALAPVTAMVGEDSMTISVDPLIFSEGSSDSYDVTIDGRRVIIVGDLALSLAMGIAGARGLNLISMLTEVSPRSGTIQALMICHGKKWITYNGYERRSRDGSDHS